jgi:hypothetical protein
MAIGMSARSEAAKKWRQDLIEAFQIMQDLMVEEANRRLRKLTRPRTRIRVPVYNAWDNKYYTVDTKIKNYTPVEMAIIRKAGTAIQIRRMAANLRKWEKEHNNGESVLKYMPSVHRPTDKSGKFKEAVPETMLRVRKLPKFLLTAFKRKDYVLQEADEG